MNVNIDQTWKNQLIAEFDKPYFKTLKSFIETEYASHTCFPKESEIFAAFDYCSFDKVKVVIIGQDPYHGLDQAHGLCFSVNEQVAIPPSLVNILKEIEADLQIPFPKNGNLQRWAKQGILMLNATLTVRENHAGSHQNKAWEKFTDAIIRHISLHKENVIFLLWGGYAKKKGSEIDTSKHFVLTTGHPSPLSANRGYWFGNRHFSQTNKFLKETNQLTIEW